MMMGLQCIKLQTLVGRDACLWDEFLYSDNGLSGFPAWLYESGPSVSSFLWWQANAEKTDGGNLKWETFPDVGEAELDRFTVCLILFRSDAFLKCLGFFPLYMWYFGIRLFPRYCISCWERELQGLSSGNHATSWAAVPQSLTEGERMFYPNPNFQRLRRRQIRKRRRELTHYL